MKKTIILIALALLLIVPVFADTPTYGKVIVATGETPSISGVTDNSIDTKVTIKLSLHPKYVIGITDKDHKFVSEGETGTILTTKTTPDSGETKYTEAPVVDEIVMSADPDNIKLLPTEAEKYYVSYWFFECNETVKLYIKNNGAMEYKGDTTGLDATAYVDFIDFQAKVTTEGTTTVTAASNGKGTSGASSDMLLKTGTITKVLGNVEQGNLEIVMEPVSGKESLVKNIVGNYESSVTLTLKTT